MKEEQYFQALYYIGLCTWLLAFIYFSYSLFCVVYDLIQARKLQKQSSLLTVANSNKSLSIKFLIYGILVFCLLTVIPKYLFSIAI